MISTNVSLSSAATSTRNFTAQLSLSVVCPAHALKVLVTLCLKEQTQTSLFPCSCIYAYINLPRLVLLTALAIGQVTTHLQRRKNGKFVTV
jgi:hypothetical protein